ncbi:sigma 54-interacting transcriptional regulator [Hornefia butyriciproducens]|uniref:sigma 54-interacting transcriptional regulator n=1 Tax=Hornefia butyriciproducens TaxID=2652293 RepID=UPI002A912864|nr:sigma 54-interacting transcriptional regulator [Hornefia butyriciproducens]MDY5462870.1 sigma 54-interacting transcriptional regulator [Hornefia butyriciproducens]
MKRISIVYRNEENSLVMQHLEAVIHSVFRDSAELRGIYISRLRPGEPVDADIYLLSDRRLIFDLREHAVSMHNVVFMDRSILRSSLGEIRAIPPGSEVLIVNDTRDTAEETAVMLYGLGVDHVRFTLFDPENPGGHEGVRYAITPAEPALVPSHIPHVIDCGYREISFETMMEIERLLGADDPEITSRLVDYGMKIIEPARTSAANYLNRFLREKLLDEYLYYSEDVTFAVNNSGEVVFFNQKAAALFGFSHDRRILLREHIPEDLLTLLYSTDNILKAACTLNETHYTLDKKSFLSAESSIGFTVNMRDEMSIVNSETVLSNALKKSGLVARYRFSDIMYTSEIMKRTVRRAQIVAGTDHTVLILGESGVGKEIFAQAIHNASSRKDRPFLGVNCASIPESLLESELFGYEEGAFTGARKHGRAGFFERARGGTIFLDEIGDIRPQMQASLLRVLQEKQIMRVGGSQVIDIDVRVVAATNRNLPEKVQSGEFRDDLYYRLNVMQITIPPLRKRKADIRPLFDYFLENSHPLPTPAMYEKMQHHSWPGNVRELENCALYFKTFHTLPETISEDVGIRETPQGLPSQTRIDVAILRIISDSNAVGRGIGRTRIQYLLESVHITVSDIQLRKRLAHLKQRGFIEIHKGRRGATITPAGLQYLAENATL